MFALSKAKENLTRDHEHAKKLAKGIADGLDQNAKEIINVDVQNTETNIVHLQIKQKKLHPTFFLERFSTVNIYNLSLFFIFLNFMLSDDSIIRSLKMSLKNWAQKLWLKPARLMRRLFAFSLI